MKIEGPFEACQVSLGHITYPGYEHLRWEAVIQKIEPEKLFSFTWHPYGIDPRVDYSKETPTLVEFRLEKTASGTLLLLTESGFDKIPSHRREEATARMRAAGLSRLRALRDMSPRSPSRERVRLQLQAEVFAALGDQTRLLLVAKLAAGQPQSIAQLTAGSRLTRQAITKHLRCSSGRGWCAVRDRAGSAGLHSIPGRWKNSGSIWRKCRGNGTRRWAGCRPSWRGEQSREEPGAPETCRPGRSPVSRTRAVDEPRVHHFFGPGGAGLRTGY